MAEYRVIIVTSEWLIVNGAPRWMTEKFIENEPIYGERQRVDEDPRRISDNLQKIARWYGNEMAEFIIERACLTCVFCYGFDGEGYGRPFRVTMQTQFVDGKKHGQEITFRPYLDPENVQIKSLNVYEYGGLMHSFEFSEKDGSVFSCRSYEEPSHD